MSMSEIKALLAGMGFGIWPIFLSRSNLTGNLMSMVYCAVVLTIVATFTVYRTDLSGLAQTNWTLTVLGAVIGATALLTFNSGLAETSTQTVSTFIVLTTLAQIAVPALYQVTQVGITSSKLIGFVLAGVAAYLLAK